MAEQPSLNITLQHFRCFSQSAPVSFTLHKGQTLALVGKNNVGKSTLMRFFYELKQVLVEFDSGNWSVSGNTSRENSHSSPLISNRYGLSDYLQLFPNKDSSEPVSFSFSYSPLTCSFSISKTGSNYILEKTIRREAEKQNANEIIQHIFNNTLYIGAHRNLVNQSAGGGGYYDLSVGTAFVAEWDALKNGTNTEMAGLALKTEKLIADLIEWPSISLNRSTDGAQLYVISQKGRYALSELGAGLSEIILCIVTAAIKRPSWILIDEPESHLHPALQIKFLASLELLASEGVVFTTHSIGLARSCADTVLVMQQDEKGQSTLRKFEAARNFSELMGELSFSQFHELGFDKILLCEGVTDVKTLRQFLRLWGLDSSVMIVPLGGNSLIDPNRQDEIAEFKRFGVDVFVLIDSEKCAPDKEVLQRTKFVEMCRSLFGKGHAIQTERRATENYLTLRAITAAKRSNKYRALEPFENADNYPMFWGKNENWRVAAEMTKQELGATDLAAFFDTIQSQQ